MVGPEQILVRDEGRYTAHPHLACLAGGSWLMVATSGPRRAVTLHPPLDPDFITIAIRSDDEGLSWTAPQPVPSPGIMGCECSGLTALPDGDVLLDQWRFRWFRDGEVPEASEREGVNFVSAEVLTSITAGSLELDGPVPAGTIAWARGGGALTLWRSETGGRDWCEPAVPDLFPYQGGYGLRGGLAASSGDILLPLTDPPDYRRVFLIRSRDDGRSWERPVSIAEVPEREFEEPSLLELDDGSLLILMRENVGRELFTGRSHDGGATWTAPRAAGLAGFPAHLLRLQDGRIAAVTGDRSPPGSILLTVSDDAGQTWDRANAIVVAGDLGTHDLGYPTAALCRDGSIFVAYYRRDAQGTTGLYARRVRIPTTTEGEPPCLIPDFRAAIC